MVRIDTDKEQLDLCLKYVEDKPAFLRLMNELKVFRSFVKHGKMRHWRDNEYRNIYRFTFERNGKTASILFGDSINNSVSGLQPNLYEALTVLGSEMSLYINCNDYEDFLDETGYDSNEHSLKIYHKLCQNGQRILKILDEDEIFVLPN